jgi:hypothetical protein
MTTDYSAEAVAAGAVKTKEEPTCFPRSNDNEKKRRGKMEETLIKEGMKAFGIKGEHLFSARIDGDEAVIVTKGGTKVRYSKGAKVKPLGEKELTGESPQQEMVWDAKLNGRRPKDQ